MMSNNSVNQAIKVLDKKVLELRKRDPKHKIFSELLKFYKIDVADWVEYGMDNDEENYEYNEKTINSILDWINMVNEFLNPKVNEISQRNIRPAGPLPHQLNKGLVNDLSKLTLGNLKHLRDKALRFIRYYRQHEDIPQYQKELKNYKLWGDEIKKRLAYINKPVMEDHGLGYSHNVSVPGDENTMNKSTIGPLKEYKDPQTRLKAVSSSDLDRSVQMIYQWTVGNQLKYSEFEDLLAEVIDKIFQNIKGDTTLRGPGGIFSKK